MKKFLFFSLFVASWSFLSCEKNMTNPKFEWDEFSGDYTGEFDYNLYTKNTQYRFTVNRNSSLIRVSTDTFKTIFTDTTYIDVPIYYTQRNPFLDTVYYWDIHLESQDLHSYLVEYVGLPEEGTIVEAQKIINEEYEITSGLQGVKYLNDTKNKHSIHIHLERYLPLHSDKPDSTAEIFYRSYR